MNILIFFLLICFEAHSQVVESDSQAPIESNGVTQNEANDSPISNPQNQIQNPIPEEARGITEEVGEVTDASVVEQEILETSQDESKALSCEEILALENLENLIQEIALLDETWICFNKLYSNLFNESTDEIISQARNIQLYQTPSQEQSNLQEHNLPRRVLNVLELVKGGIPYTPPYELMQRLPVNVNLFPFGLSSAVVTETSSHLFKDPQSLTLSPFESMENHLLSNAFINDYYFNPIGYLLTQEQVAILRSYLHFEDNSLYVTKEEISSQNTTFYFPTIALCEKDPSTSSFLNIYEHFKDKTEAFISTHKHIYVEYLNLIALQNFTNTQDTLNAISHLQMYHFLPYGFDFHQFSSETLDGNEKQQEFAELITVLKEYSFIKNIILKDLNCLNNFYQESLTFSKSDSHFIQHGDLDTSLFTFPEETFILPENNNPHLKIHYTFNEFPEATYTFLNPSAKISYTTFNIPYKKENHLFNYNPYLSEFVESLLEDISPLNQVP